MTKIQLKDKPLADSTVTRLLTYSLYSRFSLKFNIQCLNWYQSSMFWRFICIIQDKRKDLSIFETTKYYEYLTKCIKKRNDPINQELNINFYNKLINEENAEHLHMMLTYPEQCKEYYGAEYESKLQYYKDAVNNPESYVEDLDKKFENSLVKDIADVWPDEKECKELWSLFNSNPTKKKETALLNSIASLIHVAPERERILAYYLIPTKRIKLAEYPLLDSESTDPYVIQPKLIRPITDNIVNYLTDYAKRFKDKEADKIVHNWLTQGNIGEHKLFIFICLVIHLQLDGREFIEEEVFNKVFDREIRFIRDNGFYIPPSQDDFFKAMQFFKKDKDSTLREIAILVQEGYSYNDVYEYYKNKPIKVEGIVF